METGFLFQVKYMYKYPRLNKKSNTHKRNTEQILIKHNANIYNETVNTQTVEGAAVRMITRDTNESILSALALRGAAATLSPKHDSEHNYQNSEELHVELCEVVVDMNLSEWRINDIRLNSSQRHIGSV